MSRNKLKGSIGYKIHALLCGAGHDMRITNRKLRKLFSFFTESKASYFGLST